MEQLTPKEKAQELVDGIYHILLSEGNLQCYKEAILCALKNVDEILKNFGTLTGGQTFYTEYRAVKYYQEVKQELENLKNK